MKSADYFVNTSRIHTSRIQFVRTCLHDPQTRMQDRGSDSTGWRTERIFAGEPTTRDGRRQPTLHFANYFLECAFIRVIMPPDRHKSYLAQSRPMFAE